MARSLEMNFVREILRLLEIECLSQRETAKAVHKSRDAVSNVVKMAKANNITYSIAVSLSDDELKKFIYPNSNPYRDIPEPDLEYIDKEMKTHKNMTMTMLHEEYLKENPNGLKYTQFCERYRDYLKTRKISMHVERKAGETMEIDWVGDKLKYIDITGKQCVACFLVTTLGRSTYPYVEAFPNQNQNSFKQGVINALEYYGGVPEIMVPDNDKSAVTKTSKYDVVLNSSFNELVEYYGCVCIPARVRTPKDKPNVEKAVFDAVERYILLKIRDMEFHSIAEINSAIKFYLNEFVDKPFQKKEGSRRTVFELEDKPMLKPLPLLKYEIVNVTRAKVNIDYHIEYDHKYYSVPYTLIGEFVEVKAKTSTIEIWHNNKRIYTHCRSYKNMYTTLPEHMPEKHQAYHKINQHSFKNWASSVSPDVLEFVTGLFNGVKIEQTKYRACLGIQKLSRTNLDVFLEAIKLCNEHQAYSFTACNEIFKRLLKNPPSLEETPIKNDNIRGSIYYAEGGEHNE